MTLKATPLFDHDHPITIKELLAFQNINVLACKKSARFIHSFRD